MTIDKLLEDIVLSRTVFKSLIVSTNYSKLNENEISWKNYKPGIFKTLYAKEYETLIRDKQYSLHLKDNGGLIQFFYQFQDAKLVKMKLAYYPYPIGLRDTTEDLENLMADYNDESIAEYYYDLYNLFSVQFKKTIPDETLSNLIEEAKEAGDTNDDEVLMLGTFESKYKFTNSSHIRIDFDSNVTTHNKCEIQMGGINIIRLPLNKIIMPFTFCDFIFKNVYKTEYKSISRKKDYQTIFINAKKKSSNIAPFGELSLFLNHL